jgi:hypothetical protein
MEAQLLPRRQQRCRNQRCSACAYKANMHVALLHFLAFPSLRHIAQQAIYAIHTILDGIRDTCLRIVSTWHVTQVCGRKWGAEAVCGPKRAFLTT